MLERSTPHLKYEIKINQYFRAYSIFKNLKWIILSKDFLNCWQSHDLAKSSVKILTYLTKKLFILRLSIKDEFK